MKDLVKTIFVAFTVLVVATVFTSCSTGESKELQSTQPTSEAETGSTVIQTEAETESSTISAYLGEKISWEFDEESGRLTVKGEGDIIYPFDGSDEIREAIQYIDLPDGITSLCDSAFEDCYNLKEIAVPYSLTEIGARAFAGCKELGDIKLHDDIRIVGEDAFLNTKYYGVKEYWNRGYLVIDRVLIKCDENYCGKLTLPVGVTCIADKAFYFCEGLTQVIVPESVLHIGEYAFARCSSLESVTMEGEYAFWHFSENAFEGCQNISELNIYRGDYFWILDAFRDSKYIKSGEIKTDGITYLGDYIVKVDQSLSGKCIIKEGVKVIDAAFFNKTDITSIHLPASLKTIADNSEGDELTACSFGYKLQEVYVSEDNPYFTSEDGVLYNKDKTWIVCYPMGKADERFVLPDSVIRISHEFTANEKLRCIVIGANVEYIEPGLPDSSWCDAFWGCRGLERIEVSEKNQNYSSDENGMLYNKNKTVLVYYPSGKSNKEYTVPSCVETVKANAFSGAEHLEKIYVGKNVKEINCYGFYQDYENDRMIEIYYAGTRENWSEIEGNEYSDEWLHFND